MTGRSSHHHVLMMYSGRVSNEVQHNPCPLQTTRLSHVNTTLETFSFYLRSQLLYAYIIDWLYPSTFLESFLYNNFMRDHLTHSRCMFLFLYTERIEDIEG